MRASKTTAWTATILMMAVMLGRADAKSCDDDSIQSVSDDGSVLIMLSGHIYEVDAVDTVDTELWLAADDVLVCDDGEIINTDESGEKASVKRLK